jgi:hypothetical protein
VQYMRRRAGQKFLDLRDRRVRRRYVQDASLRRLPAVADGADLVQHIRKIAVS